MNDAPDIDLTPYIIPEAGCLDFDRCPDCWEKQAHIERYEFACRVLAGKPKHIVDLGCGVGYGSEMLLNAGNKVYSVDASAEARRWARDRLGHQVYATVEEALAAAGGLADAVVAFEVIEHIAEPRGILAAVNAAEFIGSVPVIPTVGYNPWHRRDYTEESFERLIAEFWPHCVSRFRQTPPGQKEPRYLVVHYTSVKTP